VEGALRLEGVITESTQPVALTDLTGPQLRGSRGEHP